MAGSRSLTVISAATPPPKAIVPVLVLDVTEAEAEKILLTFDPLAAMAVADSDAVKRLLETVRTDSRAVGELLERVVRPGRMAGHQ